MRIFITGGTGFNGKYVVRKFDNGTNRILLLSRETNRTTQSKNISILAGDLSSIENWKDSLKKFKPEVTAHLAWEGIPDYSIKNSVKNLNYGLELIELLGKVGCKSILTTGTIWEYGNQKGKLSEDFCIKPFNALSAAKNSLHYLGREIAKDYNMNFIWTRLTNSYGSDQHETSLIAYVIKAVLGNKRVEIRNPNAVNDFIYVADVADAICQLILGYKKSGVFNIGSGRLISIKTITEKIFKTMRVQKEYTITEKKLDDSFSGAYADISRIGKSLGWKPKISIDEGIKKTIDYLSSSKIQ